MSPLHVRCKVGQPWVRDHICSLTFTAHVLPDSNQAMCCLCLGFSISQRFRPSLGTSFLGLSVKTEIGRERRVRQFSLINTVGGPPGGRRGTKHWTVQ